MIIEGAISVKSALQNKKRQITEIYISKDKKTKDFNYIRKLARSENVPLREMKAEELKEILSGKSNGGIGAEVSLRKEDEFSEGDIFYLDGIEDPFNLGYAMRTAYALGVKNILLSQRDYGPLEMQLLKSSAGAYDMLNIRICKDPFDDIAALKNNGYYLYGLFRGENSKDIFDVTFKDKALFMLGGEKRGISSALLEMCDEHLYIAYGSSFRNSLNACAALDVVATLLFNQRKRK